MRGWAVVAGLAAAAAAVTALLLWWRWRQFGAALPVLAPGAPRHRRGDPLLLWVWLVGGLAAIFTGRDLAVRHGDHVLGVVGIVLGAVTATLGIGGLLIQRAWRRR